MIIWNISIFNRRCIFNGVHFPASYVSLPECQMNFEMMNTSCCQWPRWQLRKPVEAPWAVCLVFPTIFSWHKPAMLPQIPFRTGSTNWIQPCLGMDQEAMSSRNHAHCSLADRVQSLRGIEPMYSWNRRKVTKPRYSDWQETTKHIKSYNDNCKSHVLNGKLWE